MSATIDSLRLRLLNARISICSAKAASVLKMNACHVPSGSKGGQFCSGGSTGTFKPGSAMSVLYGSLVANDGMWVSKESLLKLIGPGSTSNVSNPEGRLSAMKKIGKESGKWELLVSKHSVMMKLKKPEGDSLTSKPASAPTLVLPKPSPGTSAYTSAHPAFSPTTTKPSPPPAPVSPFPSPVSDSVKNTLQNTHGQAWAEKLTPSERDSVSGYTGVHYATINKALRSETNLDPKAVTHIKNIDSAIKKSTVPEDIVVFRSVGPSAIEGMKEGMVYTDRGFVSTSFTQEISLGGSAAKFAIKIPAGANAAFVRKISQYPSEDEVLLPRNSFFKVLKIEGSEYSFTKKITLELL